MTTESIVASSTTPATLTPDGSLCAAFERIRNTTRALSAPLHAEDMVVQTMPDVSPTKWHLAHTTWFFEEFILREHAPGYREFHPQYGELFNSYYQAVGQPFPRHERGLLSRPTVADIFDYRRHVDVHMLELLDARPPSADLAALVVLGLEHEQQHQELLLTDIKHVLSRNPLRPVYRERRAPVHHPNGALRFESFAGGLRRVGFDGDGFDFDNEGPCHAQYLNPYSLADRLISNGEYLQFISDGGYKNPALWLADGWALRQAQSWHSPLYWSADLTREFTLEGERALDLDEPVCHVSYYEADAFARWAGARLPTEAEWESAAALSVVTGNFMESGELHPRAGLSQLFGDTWEWTASAYLPYPGYVPYTGRIGEYNGKFMINQMVLRGGSCASAQTQLRASYRNFFPPHARWQFAGFRLAEDA